MSNYAQRFHALFPQPDREITQQWMRLLRDICDDENSVGREESKRQLMNQMTFIARHFSPDTLQRLYQMEGKIILPMELMVTAICIETGSSTEELMELAKSGCLYGPLLADGGQEGGFILYTLSSESGVHAFLADARNVGQPVEKGLDMALEMAGFRERPDAGVPGDGRREGQSAPRPTPLPLCCFPRIGELLDGTSALSHHVHYNVDSDAITVKTPTRLGQAAAQGAAEPPQTVQSI